MKCLKCNGYGYIRNPKRKTMSKTEAWESDCLNDIKCPVCGGSGFILGNYNEIMDLLNSLIKNNTHISVRELKQIRNLIIKR